MKIGKAKEDEKFGTSEEAVSEGSERWIRYAVHCTVQYVGDMHDLFFFDGTYCTLALLSHNGITDSIEEEIAQRRDNDRSEKSISGKVPRPFSRR